MAFSVDVVAQPSLSPSQPPHHPTCLSLSPSPCPTHTRTHMKSVSGQLTLPFRAHLAVHQPVCLGRGGREGGRGGRVRPSSGHCPTQSFGERGDGGIQVERATHFIHDSALLFGTDTGPGHIYVLLNLSNVVFRTLLVTKRKTHDCPSRMPVRFSTHDMRSPPCKSFSRDSRAEVDQHGRAHRILFKTAFCLPPIADLQFEGGLADAHADPHAGGEALQMLAMQQVLRQLQLPLPAHADTPGNQALQVSSHFPSLPLSSTLDG